MTLTEKDHLEAIRNQLQRQLDALKRRLDEANRRGAARIAALSAKIDALDGIRKDYDVVSDIDALLFGDADDVSAIQQQAPAGKVPISIKVDEFLGATGRESFTAADVLHYLQGLGYEGKWLYNSVYESLTRRVKAGRLEKGEGKFKVKGEQP